MENKFSNVEIENVSNHLNAYNVQFRLNFSLNEYKFNIEFFLSDAIIPPAPVPICTRIVMRWSESHFANKNFIKNTQMDVKTAIQSESHTEIRPKWKKQA